MEKLKRGLLVLFVLNKDEECLFMIGGDKACNFTFLNHMVTLIGFNYFEIKHVKHTVILLCILKDGTVRKCNFLAKKIRGII